MSAIFLKIVNMSITAGWMILAVVLTRLLLKKAPKWIPCLLWGLVAIRLVCPFSFGSIFSLIPSNETIPADIAVQQEPAINSGITAVNEFINPVIAESFTPSPADSVNPLQVIISVAAIVWISGMVLMLAYALISYIKLKKTVSVSVPVSERIQSCDEVKAPFILGVFRPAIYVPSSMTGETLDLVIRHETAHLQRHDHWWKPLGYLLLAVYWFNPLCWIAYILLCRDIEMACDEKVIRDMNKDDVAAYLQALLDCSFPKKRITACPLAFGEVGVKERVKGILNYKKPAFWIIVTAILVCIVLAVCLMTDPFSIKEKSVFDKIKESPVAKMELPDGSAFLVDSEVLLLRTFAGLRLVESTLEPADTEEDWLYRIIYNPVGKVRGADEIIVSFHKDYVQINSEYYLPESGVPYSSILEWARGKYEYLLSNYGDFTIRYDLGDAALDFISTPFAANAGDAVEIRTAILFDADIHVYVDGQEISKTHYDSDYWGYSFIMPEKDVLVTARFYTKDEMVGPDSAMPKDFSFELTWNINGISSYDSETGKLVKTWDATDPSLYITTYTLTETDKAQVYEWISSLDVNSYPNTYDPGNARSEPSMTLILTVRMNGKVKTIHAKGIGLSYFSTDPKGERFLDVCQKIKNRLEATAEWKALPDYERYYE